MWAHILEKDRVKGMVARFSIVFTLMVAPEAQADVRVQVPPSCGTNLDFQSQLDELIADSESAHLDLKVEIVSLAEGGYQLQLDAPGWSRTMHDPDCSALFRAALVIAAASAEGRDLETSPPSNTFEPLSPAEEERPQELGNQGEAASQSSLAAERTLPTLDSDPLTSEPSKQLRGVKKPSHGAHKAPRPGTPIDGFLFLGIGAELAVAPEVRPNIFLGGGFHLGHWGLNADFRFTPKKKSWPQDGLGLELGMVGGRFAGSWDPVEAFHLVFGLSLTRLEASGLGVRTSETDQVFLPSIEVEAQLRPWRSHRWGVEAGVRGRMGVTTPRFQIEPNTRVYQVPRWGGTLLFRGLVFF